MKDPIKKEMIQKYIDWAVNAPLDCCPVVPIQKEEQKEHNMYVKTCAEIGNPDVEKVRYMRDRLYSIFYEKKLNAKRKIFFLDDSDLMPKTPAEIVSKIKAGDFKFNNKYVNEDGSWHDPDNMSYTSPYGFISWRKEPGDQKGYDAWKIKLETARQATEDKIRILTPEQGLEAMKEFEAQEIQ